jgi:hypothetical protein
MPSISVSAGVLSKLQELAIARNTTITGVVAEAIGLEMAFVQAQRNGSRMLIEKRGRVQEILPESPAPSWSYEPEVKRILNAR